MSASVLAAMSAVPADAADMPKKAPPPPAPAVVDDNPWVVSVEGGAAISDFSKSGQNVGFGDSFSKLGVAPKNDVGAYGAISIGRKIEGTDYDWRIGVSTTQFLDNSTSAIAEYGAVGSFDSRAGFQSVDFDLGRHVSTGMLEARLFAGVRALYEKDSTSTGLSKLGLVGESVDLSHSFMGVGPRIGADVRYGGTFALVGSVSAAEIFGQHKSEASFNVNYFGLNLFNLPLVDETATDWVTDVNASLGASWRPTVKTEISAGYRVERLGNIHGSQGDSLTSQGPFVKLDVKF